MAWFTPSQSFAEGWNPGPQLQAGNISGVLGEILQQKRHEDDLRRQQLADMIKAGQSVRSEIQANKYLDSLKGEGLVPEDYDAGGVGGATYGTHLATMIERKRREDALEAHRTAMEARIGGGRGGRGRGGAAVDTSSGPETTWDEQGREWRRGPGGRWIPVAPVRTSQTPGTPKLSPTERGWAAPEIPGLSVNINAPNEDTTALAPDIPPAPDVTPPADRNVAEGYGQPVSDADVEALSWARAHPDDPRSAAILAKLGIQ